MMLESERGSGMSRWRRKRKKKWKLGFGVKLLFLVLALTSLLMVTEIRFAPVIRVEAMQQINTLALARMAESINRQVDNYREAGDYQNLMHIERDDQGRVMLMTADTLLINNLISDLTIDICDSLNKLSEEKLRIPLLAASGSKILASLGPEVPINVTAIATPAIRLTDKFTAAGINQVKHSIYLEATAELQIAVPFESDTMTVSTKVLLAEGIIMGEIPETFIQFDTSNGN